MSKNIGTCECYDRGCPVHKGRRDCVNVAEIILYRIDTPDESGTAFCYGCADDAMEGGLFGDIPASEDDGEMGII